MKNRITFRRHQQRKGLSIMFFLVALIFVIISFHRVIFFKRVGFVRTVVLKRGQMCELSTDADVNNRCRTHENGTPLHIAASNLSLGTAKVLIERGADLHSRDDLGRTPAGKLIIF